MAKIVKKARPRHRNNPNRVRRNVIRPPTKLYGTRSMIRKLKCPVCFDYPRQIPIYTCTNGHILCSACQQSIQFNHVCDLNRMGCKGKCPVCRNHELKVDSDVQELGVGLVTNFKEHCRFTDFGCSTKTNLSKLASHEPKCQYRIVHCLAKHRNSCNWVGSLKDLVVHVKKSNCIQIINTGEDNNIFKSSIGDFSDKRFTVFGRLEDTHWKPVLLISRKICKYLIYLTMYRSGDGRWFLTARSLSPDTVLERLRVRIEVYKSGEDKGSRFIYQGHINSYNLTNQEIFSSGKLLLLSDTQLRMMRKEDTILGYTVTVWET